VLARRLAIGCTAVALFAVAGFVPAAASPRATSTTICVGLVVDPQSVGGSVSDTCVNVKPGTTGVGVLEAAGHTLTFRGDGLLCTIDGVPDSGCSDVDNTHYWSYFHRAPDSTTWSYSNENMSTYKPANRSTEGWVYDDGSALKPENIPAAQICDGLLKPAATPTPSPKRTHQTATHPKPHLPHSAPIAAATQTATPTASHRHHRRQAASTPGATLPGAVQTTAPTPTISPAASSQKSGGGSATGAIAAAAVIAVLAAATVAGARRRRP
jgi:hypothetical protein